MKVNQEGKWLIDVFKDEFEPAVSISDAQKAVNLYVKERLTGNQFSALVSLIMCIGIGAFKKSGLLRQINRSKLDRNALVKAADQFDMYIYTDDEAGQRVVDSFLVKHREFEKALFLTPELVPKRKKRK